MLDQVVGNFRILSLLGQGGMGEVYLAEHTGIQTRVAIKVLLPEISRDEQHVQRFFNEARIVGRIKHAGIVKIFDVGFHAGRAYLVMELLEGESLAARIARVGRLPTAELVDLGQQIASVLAASHAAGVVHRDLKPENIFLIHDAELGTRPRVKILDFGIAKLSGAGGPRTIGTMGTPAYMAPEQWGDAAAVDWRADLYSLGCVVFEMAAGRPPFVSTTIAEAFRHHTEVPAPPVRTIAPDTAPEIEQLLTCLLAKSPAARAESSERVARSFGLLRETVMTDEEWTDPTGTHAIAPRDPKRAATTLGASLGQVMASRRPGHRRRGAIAGIAAFGLAGLVAGVTITGGSGSATERTPGAAPPPPVAAPRPPAVEPPPAPPVIEVPAPPAAPPPIVEARPTKASPAPRTRPARTAPPRPPTPTKPTPRPEPRPPTAPTHSTLDDRT